MTQCREKQTHYKREFPIKQLPTCAYQGVRDVSFLENFAHVLNEWSVILRLDAFEANVPFPYPLKTSQNYTEVF